jgi:hypothetical protein
MTRLLTHIAPHFRHLASQKESGSGVQACKVVPHERSLSQTAIVVGVRAWKNSSELVMSRCSVQLIVDPSLGGPYLLATIAAGQHGLSIPDVMIADSVDNPEHAMFEAALTGVVRTYNGRSERVKELLRC